MANTYHSLHYHLIFSTKNRVAYLKPEIEQRVWPTSMELRGSTK